MKIHPRRYAMLAGALLLALALGGCAQFWRGFRGSVPEWNTPSFAGRTRSTTGGSGSGVPSPRVR